MSLYDDLVEDFASLGPITAALVLATAMTGVIVGFTTGLMGLSNLLKSTRNHIRRYRYYKLLKLMDSSQTEIFVSKRDCLQKGYNSALCDKSFDNAMKWAETPLTSFIYDSKDACLNIHQTATEQCYKESSLAVEGTPSGSITLLPRSKNKIIYQPDVIGWQALAIDITKSVPLYSCSRPGYALRFDQQELRLY